MGFEDLSKRIEWKTRWVAAAFRIEGLCKVEGSVNQFMGHVGNVWILWDFDSDGTLSSINCRIHEGGYYGPIARVFRAPNANWQGELALLEDNIDEVMGRGCYCLGIEEDAIVSYFPLLTAHEKLELHLSMPREFWPQKWIDEERGK